MRRPLVIFDLDNTLVDRNAIFEQWLERFVVERNLDEVSARSWLRAQDDDGMTKRIELFAEARQHFGLTDSVDELVAAFWQQQVEAFRCEPATIDALRRLRTAGYPIGIATNGGPVQEDKIRSAGLDREVDGWAVSGLVGSAKPDRLIFELVADRCGSSLDGAWVVGDRPEADIAGAVAIGAQSIWIQRGLTWSVPAFEPTHIAASVAEAAAIILSEGPET